MTYNCPKCGSRNIQITTGGVVCNECLFQKIVNPTNSEQQDDWKPND